MARAIRSDLIGSSSWERYVQAARGKGDALHDEKCPTCDVHYAVTLAVSEDIEAAVKLLRRQLLNECPQHQQESYTIKGPHPGRIIADISN
jgi:hypothetical protein